MTTEDIKIIVNETINELINRKLLNLDNYPNILNAVDKWLYGYFDGTNNNKNIGRVLKSLYSDPYIDVIYMQYRDRLTIEAIAEELEKDVSTIKRNKKRLILLISEALEI